MALLQLDFRGILDGYDALVIWNIGGEHVEQRCFSAARSAGDDDIEPALDAGLQKGGHFHGEAAVADQVIHGQRRFGKLSNREQRPF
ncbi:hypothetical protein SDC9_141256 [bioreactor metagenome]|uniref:Uncharacterized protein n=1 Tax=bioreactor metagenome TaxID=1076179 RepID=A0A645DZS1_9ZZZZ